MVPDCSDGIQKSSVIFLERALQIGWQSLVPEGVLEGRGEWHLPRMLKVRRASGKSDSCLLVYYLNKPECMLGMVIVLALKRLG